MPISLQKIAYEKKNRVECNGSGYTGSDGKIIKFPNPPDIRAFDGCVTEGDGDGDGQSIYLRTLINQTQGLSADLRGRTSPEGVRQSSADSELRGGYRFRRSKESFQYYNAIMHSLI